MCKDILIHHVGLQCDNKENALLFYQELLGLDIVKSYTLSKQLAKEIFDVNTSVEVIVFQNESLYLEIFISGLQKNSTCAHVCLMVDDLPQFIEHCSDHKVYPYSVKKGKKVLWFLKDFAGNIFELKEK